jgi:hypothetical protein
MTKRARPHFRLSEYPSGDIFIVLEQLDGDQLEFTKRTIGFDLPSGTKMEEAERIRHMMSEKLVFVTET